ncbi:L-type amino acid transporter [compost metagenome]
MYAFVPILYLIFSFLLIVLPIWTSPVEASIGTIILITGIPVYYLTAHWQEKPDSYQQAIDWFNRVTQKLTFSVTPTSDISIT